LREEPELSELPARLSLFGLTRLPPSYLEVLGALAVARDVHLFLLHPSPVLWSRIKALAEASVAPIPPIRALDTTADLVRHPLLASWGRDAREMQLVIVALDDAVPVHHALEPEPDSLLRQLQADIRADRPPPGAPARGHPDERAVLDPSDTSIQVHACHGRTRQVDVLREAILHLLADDPTLEPRDVIVMCPDIDAYAPLIDASFLSASTDDDEDAAPSAYPDLRVRLADRSLR
jgi:exodeoxyribonuclease V gamma subunit